MGNQIAKQESKINLSSNSDAGDSPFVTTTPTLLAWCSKANNKISVIDLETKQNYVTFDGARTSDTEYSWTHVKEIPNNKLLVSLHHGYRRNSANMEIFDISKKGKANKIYSLGEVSGSKLVVGYGDVTYNSRRGILGAIPVAGRIAYHLFTIDTSASNAGGIVKLNRKSKWHSQQYGNRTESYILGFDFNPAGESIATIDAYGVCLIADVNTKNFGFNYKVGYREDPWGRCRWSTNTCEPLLFVKHEDNKLNILDAEKKGLTLRNSVQLEADDHWINCVRWNPSGDMLASASDDKTVKLLDLKTGKVFHTDTTSDGSKH